MCVIAQRQSVARLDLSYFHVSVQFLHSFFNFFLSLLSFLPLRTAKHNLFTFFVSCRGDFCVFLSLSLSSDSRSAPKMNFNGKQCCLLHTNTHTGRRRDTEDSKRQQYLPSLSVCHRLVLLRTSFSHTFSVFFAFATH
jgi:hypothetical protein